LPTPLIIICISYVSKLIHYFVLFFLQNEVDSIRLKTDQYEMIVAQQGNFTIIVSQCPKQEVKAEEKKEGEAEGAGAAAAAKKEA
jgi:hypothetical protein